MGSARLVAYDAVKLYLMDEQRMRRYGLPAGIAGPECKFAAPIRRWAADFCYKPLMLIIEVEGGTFARAKGKKSRHTTGTGYADDCVKYSIASLLGYCIIRVTADMVSKGSAFDLIDAALEERRSQFGVSAASQTTISEPMAALIRKMPKQYRAAKTRKTSTKPRARKAVAA